MSVRAGKWRLAVGIALASALLVFGQFFGRWKIPQGGMFPTYPPGGRIFARKRPYTTVAAVQRGDVIIYKTERDGDRYDFIWRVVGLPGERIAIHADTVMVNGRALPRRELRQQDGLTIFEETADGASYEIALPALPDDKSELAEIRVPPGHVFVLGDNRHDAYDSRRTGSVPFDAIVARAIE
jgi:signal peptidase I